MRKAVKIVGILILCSAIIAIPTTLLILDKSMVTAESVYRNVSILFHLTSPAQVSIDDNGIPVVDYGYKGQTYIGKQMNPLFVASKAIEYYDKFKESGDLTYKTYFENNIDWLEKEKFDRGRYYLWAYNYPVPSYGISADPWYSALAQGRIMLAFERAYELTGEERYRELANKAMLSLDTPIEEGGMMYRGQDSVGKWYTELVSPARDQPPLILNGHMGVLLYLHEFYQSTGSEYAQRLFQEGIAGLKPHLPEYDTGRWTYYDREGNLAYDYHYAHVEMLQALYEITGDEVLKEYHDKWASYFPLNPMWARKRLAAYLLNATITLLALTAVVFSYMLYQRHFRRSLSKPTR